MSDLQEMLTQAFDDRDKDINRWTWKMSNGAEIKMVDMTYDQLQRAYWHVIDMLYNKDPYHPGVQRKRDQVRKMWDCANTELLLRYILHECRIDVLKTNKDLLDFISAHKREHGLKNSDTVDKIFTGLPDVFSSVTIDMLLSACLDSLDAFNRRLISDKFILSLGIWLTEDEKKDLTEYDSNGRYRSKKDVIKERLFLNNNVELRFNPQGLSYNEFRAIVRLEGRPKFSNIPTNTVTLLRDKILLLLDHDLEYHINRWSTLKEKIEAVAMQNNFILKPRDDNQR